MLHSQLEAAASPPPELHAIIMIYKEVPESRLDESVAGAGCNVVDNNCVRLMTDTCIRVMTPATRTMF